jgi:sugar diacid utilization regulator
MEWALGQSIHQLGYSENVPYNIARMLEGYDIEPSVVEYQLQHWHWKTEDTYQVFRLVFEDGSKMDEATCKKYYPSLKEIISQSILFTYENSLIVIAHGEESQFKKRRLESALEQYEMRAGVSMQFYSFLNLKYAYLQCKHALKFGKTAVTEFQDVYVAAFLFHLDQATSVKSLCHPQVLQLWQNGGKGKEYVSCLYEYLQSGRNLTDAAKKLNIHRNTLSYRIELIGKLLRIDLNANLMDDQSLMLLLMSCQIVKHFDG